MRGVGRAAQAAVILNAAAALYVGGLADDFDEGVARARESLRAGAGITALERLRAAYTRA